MPRSRITHGNLFQNLGPAQLNDRSPYVILLVLGVSKSVGSSHDRSVIVSSL